MPLPKFLINRYKSWKDTSFNKNKKNYKKLALGPQKPKAMIISCCDSRVQESSIFSAQFGEFFIHKNIANLIPPHNSSNIDFNTLSTLEYAINNLKISHIIIMGHSNCGGIAHSFKIFSKKNKNNNNYLNNWLASLKPAYDNLPVISDEKKKIKLLEKEGIKNSIYNLQKFPKINNLIVKKKLEIHGLWYDIGTGNIEYLDLKKGIFQKIIY